MVIYWVYVSLILINSYERPKLVLVTLFLGTSPSAFGRHPSNQQRRHKPQHQARPWPLALFGMGLDWATKRSIFGEAKPIPMKYAVLLLALMFVGCGGGSSTGTVGYVLKDYRGTLQIANEDLSSEMNFVEAMKACEGLGNGWRLPHVWELDIM